MKMLKQHLYFFVLAYFLVAGCGDRSDKGGHYSFKATNEVVTLPLSSDSRNFVTFYDSFVNNDTTYFACYNERSNRVELYNVTAMELSGVIQFQAEGTDPINGISDFIMQSLDSLIVINPGEKGVSWVNREGKILKKVAISFDSEGRAINVAYYRQGLKNFLLGDKVYLGQEYRIPKMQMLTADVFDDTRVNVTVNMLTGESVSSTLTYPPELLDRDGTGLQVYRDYSSDTSFIYHFSYLNSLFVTKDHHSFRQYPIVTDYNLQLIQLNTEAMTKGFEQYYDYILKHDKVVNIHYDRYRDYCYLIVSIRGDGYKRDKDTSIQLMYPRCMVIILDKGLNTVGEYILPEDTYSCQMMFVAPEGLYISEDHPNNPDFDEDFMRFRLFTLKKN